MPQLKVDKDFSNSTIPTTTNEKDLYDIVVCQADKRVITATQPSIHSTIVYKHVWMIHHSTIAPVLTLLSLSIAQSPSLR